MEEVVNIIREWAPTILTCVGIATLYGGVMLSHLKKRQRRDADKWYQNKQILPNYKGSIPPPPPPPRKATMANYFKALIALKELKNKNHGHTREINPDN